MAKYRTEKQNGTQLSIAETADFIEVGIGSFRRVYWYSLTAATKQPAAALHLAHVADSAVRHSHRVLVAADLAGRARSACRWDCRCARGVCVHGSCELDQ